MRTDRSRSFPRSGLAFALVAALGLAAAGAAPAEIRTHPFAVARQASPLRTHAWRPDAATAILVHDWRTRERSRIPTARTGDARTTQSWNPAGERYAPSRIRTHEWRPGVER
jgi:hypothetical protein